LGQASAVSDVFIAETPILANNPKEVNQCGDCLTIYDPLYGNPEQHIPSNTLFEDLPKDYFCPVCEGGKDAFQQVIKFTE